MPSELVLTGVQRDQIVHHALKGYPKEVVGLLGGSRDGRVKRVIALENLLGSRSFLADPYEQYQALRAFQASQISPLAVYHSHPDGGATLSQADLHFARQSQLLQVVVAIDRTRVRGIRAYCLSDGIPRLIPLLVLPGDGQKQETDPLREKE